MDASGRLYVMDHFNERVQVFQVSDGSVPPSAEHGAPETTVTSPAANAEISLGPVTVRGSATDDVAVARVYVAIRDRDTKAWWRADGTWGAYQRHVARLSTPDSASSTWTFGWTPPKAGRYAVQARAEDNSGTLDATPVWRFFTVP